MRDPSRLRSKIRFTPHASALANVQTGVVLFEETRRANAGVPTGRGWRWHASCAEGDVLTRGGAAKGAVGG